MGMRLVEKLGSGKHKVSIKRQARDNALYCSYWSSIAGRPVTERVEGNTMNAARKQAARISAALNRRAPSAVEAHSQVSVKEALENGILHSKSKSPHHRNNLRMWDGYFRDYLGKHHPEITRWDQVRYAHLSAYVEHLKARPVSPSTAEHYCSVISITSNYYAKRVNPALFISIPCVHPYFQEDDDEVEARQYLTPEQSVALLHFAHSRQRRNDNGLLTVALGCFVGCNLMEIVRLKVSSVIQRADGLVYIKIEQSKNDNRRRWLPVPAVVRPILVEAISGRGSAEWLTPGKDGEQATHLTLANNLREHLLPAAAKFLKQPHYLVPVPSDVVRTTFVNMAIKAKVKQAMRDAFIGHGQHKVLRMYYDDPELIVDELKCEVTDKIDGFFERLRLGKKVDIA